MASTQHVDDLLAHYENLIAFYATYPQQCDLDGLLKVNFDVHEVLSNHRVQRSDYLKQAMDILRNPLRNDLPIPWEKIRSLDPLRDVGVKAADRAPPGSPSERRLKRVEVAPAEIGDESVQDRQSKRRKVERRKPMEQSQGPSSRHNKQNKRVEIDDGDYGPVKMEDRDIEIQSADVFEDLDVVQKICDNCLRSNQTKCPKSGRGGACDFCAKRHLGCNLTEAVRAHWKAIGDPRGRSRSRSVEPKMKSRASSVASTSGRQTKTSTSRGRTGAAGIIRPDSVAKELEPEIADPARATPVPRGRRTNTRRIAELEGQVSDLHQRMEHRNEELIQQLIQAVEEGKEVEGRLQRRLEEYEREHRAMRSVADEVVKAMKLGIGQKCDVGVGPDIIQSERGPDHSRMEDGTEDMIVDGNITSVSDAAYLDAVQVPDITPSKEDSSCGEEMDVDPNQNPSSVAQQPATTSESIMEEDTNHGGQATAVHPPQPTTETEEGQPEGATSAIASRESIQEPEDPPSNSGSTVSPESTVDGATANEGAPDSVGAEARS